MSEFLELLPPPAALEKLLTALAVTVRTERVQTADSLHRTLAQDIVAPFPLPTFARSTVDGYAVQSASTHGASESLPAYLKLVGEVAMGSASDLHVGKGGCALIHTGGMLPKGADAVVMVEFTQAIEAAKSQRSEAREIEMLRAVANGENVLQVGEDVQTGDVVMTVGTRIRPAEIGGLMALGITEVDVAVAPRVGILSSGDEVVPAGQPLELGQVYDVNSHTLEALVRERGGIPIRYGILADEISAFRETAVRAVRECDIVIFTAGSSVSVRDLTAQTIDELGAPGVLVHGVNVRPGKPTILAVVENRGQGSGGRDQGENTPTPDPQSLIPIIGLPGNPVSALVIANIFVSAVIDKFLGVQPRPRGTVSATLTTNLASQSGREEWVPVRLVESPSPRQARDAASSGSGRGAGYRAEPIFGKSNLIFTLARADGLLRIHPDANGIAAGEQVTIQLL